MPATENILLSRQTKRIIFVLAAFVLSYLAGFLIDPYNQFWKNYFNRSVIDISTEWGVTLLFCIMVAESSLAIHNQLNKRLRWTENPVKRFLVESALNILAVLLIIAMHILCTYLIFNSLGSVQNKISQQDIRDMMQWIVISLAITFTMMAINTGSYMISNWQKTELEVVEHQLRVSELRQASIEAELNALRLQIDPHFIFNNLSVLSELILENQELGYQFSENFSKVYRFLLINSRKNMISVEEELKFLKSYIFLLQHRIGNGVEFSIEVDESSFLLFLPPLTLQLLVENALKHNKTNKDKPLHIRIYNEGTAQLVVENNLLPLENSNTNSTGLGLANITSRFNLLSQQLPEIAIIDGHFKVIIHLMKYDKQHSNN